MESVEQRQDVVTRQSSDEFNSLQLEDINNRVCNTHYGSDLYWIEKFLKKPSSSSCFTNLRSTKSA
jgi:hypothetical protein